MRVARTVLIVVVILGGLFVAADRFAVSYAEGRAADQAKASENLTVKPKVTIEGFPFLTQIALGTLKDVKISSSDMGASVGSQTLTLDSFTAELHDVKFSNGFTKAVADTGDGDAFVSYASVNKAVPDGMTVAYGGAASDGKALVKLSGTYQNAAFTVTSELTVTGDQTISLHAQSLPTAFTALGLSDEMRQAIDLQIKLPSLPAGLKVTSVTTAADGVTVAVGGKDVVLAS
jgi:hypothetical protein